MKQSAHMAPARPLLRRRRRPLKQSQPFSRRIQRDYKQIWVLLREGAQEIGLSFSDNKAKYIGRNLYSLGGMEFKMLVLRKQGSSTSHWKEQSQPFKHCQTLQRIQPIFRVSEYDYDVIVIQNLRQCIN